MAAHATFRNTSFRGRFGPDDIALQGWCQLHGFVEVFVPRTIYGSGSMRFEDSTAQCPVPGCDRQARIFDVLISFQHRAISQLAGLPISRQQARRLERTVKGRNSEAVKRVSTEISPEWRAVVDDAYRLPSPKEALEWLGKFARFLAAAGIAYGGLMTGLEAHLNILEKLSADPPSEVEPNDPPGGEAEIEPENENKKRSPQKRHRQIDV